MLKSIHMAVKTAKIRNAGTRSAPVLILSNNNRDLLQHTFDLGDTRLEEGKTHILSADVSHLDLPTYYNYTRLGIRGADAWHLNEVFVWAELKSEQGGGVWPIAMRYWSPDELSTDEREGLLSMPLFRTNRGGSHTPMNRLMVVIQNENKRYAGTKSPVKIVMETKHAEPVEMEIPAGSLDEAGEGYLQIAFTPKSFHSHEIRSIKVEIMGDDAWTPQSLMVFGMDNYPNDYEVFVPLAHILDWKEAGLGQMSSDEKEGQAVVELYRAYL